MKRFWMILILLILFIPDGYCGFFEFDTDNDNYLDLSLMPLDELWTFQEGITISTGKHFTLGTIQWDDGSNKINGEYLADDTVDDDSLDFSDITLNDFTFDVGSVSKTEYGYLNGVTGALQGQIDLKAPLASPTLTGTVVLPSDQALLGSPTIATSIDPDTADGATIGSATKEWSDIFLAAGGVIYGENDQSNTLTSSATGWTANLNLAATTYGSDGTVLDAELLYINSLSSNAQAQITARLKKTTGGDDLLVTSGDIIRPAATTSGHKVIIQAYNGSAWVSAIEIENTAAAPVLVNIPDGSSLIAGVTALKIKNYDCDTLSDATSPHLLTAAEVSGTIISNYDSSAAAKDFDFPAAAEGYNVIFILGLAQNTEYDPNASEIIHLNGVALAGGNSVKNTAPTIGESMACHTFKFTGGAWAWSCRSADTDFADKGS